LTPTPATSSAAPAFPNGAPAAWLAVLAPLAVLALLHVLTQRLVAADPPGVLRFEQALMVESAATEPPRPEGGAPVRLPLLRAKADGATPGAAWFSIPLTLAADATVPHTLALSYRPTLAVYLDGQLLEQTAPTPLLDRADRHFQVGSRALAVSVPPSLLAAGPHVLELRLGTAGYDGATLSTVRLGPADAMAERQASRTLLLWARTGVAAAAAMLGMFLVFAWIALRREWLYGLAGVNALLMAFLLTPAFLAEPPLPPAPWRALLDAADLASKGIVLLLALRFLEPAAERATRWISGAIVAGVVIDAAAAFANLAWTDFSHPWPWWALGVRALALGLASALAVHAAARRGGWDAVLTAAATALLAACWAYVTWFVLVAGRAFPVTDLNFVGFGAWVLVAAALLQRRYVSSIAREQGARVELEHQVAERTRELERNFEALRESERLRLAAAERERLLQEMHDGLGSRLVAAKISAQRGALSHEGVVQAFEECLQEMRLAVDALSVEDGDLGLLLANLRHRLGAGLTEAGLEIEWLVGDTPLVPVLAGAGGRDLVRIVQEALNNVLQHAGATKIRLETRAEAWGAVVVALTDNGRGMIEGARPGRGLRNIRARAARLGGTVDWIAAPGGGTTLLLRLPLAGSGPARPDPRVASAPGPGASAKVRVPSTEHALARPRVAEVLARPSAPVLWLTAPAGFGKTVAAAQFAARFGGAAIWLRCDRHDSDPATFFRYLHEAAGVAFPGRVPPPALRETFRGPGGDEAIALAMRRLLQALPRPFAIVLDDAHLLGADTLGALAGALAEAIPEGGRALLAGREPLPDRLVRALANERIALVDAQALRFDAVECNALLERADVEPARREAVMAAAGGWAAALVLLRESARRAAAGPGAGAAPVAPVASDEALALYIDTELLGALEPPVREMLVTLAALPDFTADDARALTGVEDADEHLEALARRNLLVERAGTVAGAWRIHPLLRELLRRRAQERGTPALQRAAALAAAGRLRSRGELGAALDVLESAGLRTEGAAWLREGAGELLRRGETATIRRWAPLAQGTPVESDPRLALALGLALSEEHDEGAMPMLARAFDGFSESGDEAGRLLAACAIVDAMQSAFKTYAGIARWLTFVLEAPEPAGLERDRDACLRVLVGRLVAGYLRSDDKAALEPLAARIEAMLGEDLDPSLRLSAAMHLANHWRFEGRWDDFDRVTARGRPLAELPTTSPVKRAMWQRTIGIGFATRGDVSAARAHFARVEALAAAHDLPEERAVVRLAEATVRIAEGDIEGAARIAGEPIPERAGPLVRSYARHVEARLHLARGRWQAAFDAAHESLAPFDEPGNPVVPNINYVAAEAAASLELGDDEAAFARIERFARSVSGGEACQSWATLTLARAYALERRGHGAAAREALAAGLAEARTCAFAGFFLSAPHVAERLCALALEGGIETAFAAEVSRRRGFASRPA
jgi:ATP/maltotriose-dependent transcriptional regulator MalT/signal transduction histidine kinase